MINLGAMVIGNIHLIYLIYLSLNNRILAAKNWNKDSDLRTLHLQSRDPVPDPSSRTIAEGGCGGILANSGKQKKENQMQMHENTKCFLAEMFWRK